MTRIRIRYQTFEFGDIDIHVRTLRDRQQFGDLLNLAENLGVPPASWPYFGIVWPAGELLAHIMLEYDIEGKRILEVGCGIALPSLVLNSRLANVTVTDYHPEVEAFLLENVKLNQGKQIPFLRTAWEDKVTKLGKFDLIIGSDVLYEQDQIQTLSKFINQHAQENCEVILVDACRGHTNRFHKKMAKFGYTYSASPPELVDYLTQPFLGQVLRYQRGASSFS